MIKNIDNMHYLRIIKNTLRAEAVFTFGYMIPGHYFGRKKTRFFMILKEFQVHVPAKGTVNVEFYVHFGEHGASAGEIKIHADYNCGIPHKVQLKKDGAIWKLYDDHPKMVNGEVKVVPEFLDDELSMTIAGRIYQITQDA